MILHIAPDDKFIPFLQGLFEEASPKENLWRVFSDTRKLVFAEPADSLEIIDNEYFGTDKFKNDLHAASCVIFHSLFLTSQQKLLALSQIPEPMPLVWRGWGFDYYDILKTNGLRLTLPETNSLIKTLDTPKKTLAKQFAKKLLGAIFPKPDEQHINNKLLARVNYFSCCVPDDFKALQQALPNFKAKFLPLNYYSTEDVFLRGDNLQNLAGHDILLGNSATATNNHIEAMRILSELGMDGRKVVVPLSYGDMRYQEKIVQAGKKLLGESFVPLTDYMSLTEYNQTVSGCGNLIMNHIRQQAMGNISAALLRGGKVFLRPENPIYKHYARMGVILFPFTDAITIADLDVPLNKEDVNQNKQIMSELWARKKAVKQAQAIFRLAVE